MPAGMLSGVSPNQVQHLLPVFEAAVVAVHELGLTEADRLNADVDVGGRKKVEPELPEISSKAQQWFSAASRPILGW
jgi:hypothetical protein